MSDNKDQNVGDVNPSDAGSTNGKDQGQTLEEMQAELEKLKKQNADFFSELKKTKTEKTKLLSEKEKAEEEKLKEQGKLQELLDKRESQLGELSGKFKSKIMDEQVKNAALKAGCSNIDAFMKLAGDYKDKVKFDDNFDADGESLNAFISSTKEAYGELGLFKSDAPPPKDAGHGGDDNATKGFADQALDIFAGLGG